MTYSIVARDRASGTLGVAVQTCMFAVGAVVPWARPGVGAVATQALGDIAYGARCLDAIAAGMSGVDALAQARASDDASAFRQVGVVDVHGKADAFTGDMCIDFAGHHVGDGFAVQANMMSSADVWPTMADAYENASGELAERLLIALEAGELAGGDARGQMSAALIVVDDAATIVDVRVDDHPDPLAELARLVTSSSAFRTYFRATDALFAGMSATALSEIEAALVVLPENENFRFVRAVALLFSGNLDEARTEMHALVANRSTWRTIVESFVSKGVLPLPPGFDVDSFVLP